VDSLKAGDVVWDTELTGFGARRNSRDASYVVKYRSAGGRQGWYTIGPHSPWTADSARIEASRILLGVRSGLDPAAQRAADNSAATVSDLWTKYLQEHAKVSKKPRSIAEDEALARDYILPQFARTRIKDLTRTDVSRWHSGLATKPVRANRALALLRAMMTKAESWGYSQEGSNPASKVPKHRERPRERYLSPSELNQLGTALTEFEHSDGCPPSATALIRVLLLTGMRLGEALNLRWGDVNIKARSLRLPDSKTGAKTIPLPSSCKKILERLGPGSAAAFVFVGKSGNTPLAGIQKIWQRIRSHAGLDGVRLHDLRHSFASVAAQSGESLYVVGKILGHKQASTTERYAHIPVDPLMAATERTAETIAAAMASEPWS
jgi:integrase